MLRNVQKYVYLGTPIYKSSRLENEYIADRIRNAYKHTWRLKAIGSKSVQINPVTFSRGFWMAIVPSLIYGFCIMKIGCNNLKLLDSMQINIAKNIQGLVANTPAIVALASLKWCRISTHIMQEAVNFMFRILLMPTMNIYKKVLIDGLFCAKSKDFKNLGNGPIAYFIEQCVACNMFEQLDKILSNGNIDSTICYKAKVKDQVVKREHKSWVATSLLYKHLQEFKATDITLITGYRWWKVAKWQSDVLYKVKAMLKLIVTNYEKIGFKCDCNCKITVAHILFVCPIVTDVRRVCWICCENEMPSTMKAQIQSMNVDDKIRFIYNCLQCSPIYEWKNVYVTVLNFVYFVSKEWHKNIKQEQ